MHKFPPLGGLELNRNPEHPSSPPRCGENPAKCMPSSTQGTGLEEGLVFHMLANTMPKLKASWGKARFLVLISLAKIGHAPRSHHRLWARNISCKETAVTWAPVQGCMRRAMLEYNHERDCVHPCLSLLTVSHVLLTCAFFQRVESCSSKELGCPVRVPGVGYSGLEYALAGL